MLVGRKAEIEKLNRAFVDEKSNFIAVYGRRRVGKTFLINEHFGHRFTFSHSGIYEGNLKNQLFAFDASLKNAGLPSKTKSKNWLDAFEKLKDLIRKSSEQRKIIFIDELSWMDTPKSDFMMALESFWNGWAAERKDILLIVCASATSWMLSKVIHNKGGLYNRLTDQIKLNEFSLRECEEYVKEKGLSINREQILQYYMICGGIPYYWSFLEKGFSLPQNIDNVFFAVNAPLKDEFKYLYASIFKNPEQYIKIIEALSTKKTGMTRDEIITYAHITNSGDLSIKLEELESCGFLRKYYAFGMKKKNALYQLIDNFTLFYYRFLSGWNGDEHFWTNQINTPATNIWMGLAFERVCLKHINQIKQKLGISGVLTNANSWYTTSDEEKGIPGAQIDLLLVRQDRVINMCEMKYSSSEYALNDATEKDIRTKILSFQLCTKTKMAIYPTLITTYGLLQNSHSGIIQSVITADDLFSR